MAISCGKSHYPGYTQNPLQLRTQRACLSLDIKGNFIYFSAYLPHFFIEMGNLAGLFPVGTVWNGFGLKGWGKKGLPVNSSI